VRVRASALSPRRFSTFVLSADDEKEEFKVSVFFCTALACLLARSQLGCTPPAPRIMRLFASPTRALSYVAHIITVRLKREGARVSLSLSLSLSALRGGNLNILTISCSPPRKILRRRNLLEM